jgi:D-amino peptidase
MKAISTFANGVTNNKISNFNYKLRIIFSLRSLRIIGYILIFLMTSECSTPVKKPLKIYINTDLEGISGVYKFAQSREKDTPLNIQACEYFMEDLAAVVQGLRDAGATEIVVLDGHGSQAVIPHLMHPGATYITGKPRPGAGNLTDLDETFDGMVMVGFHAMMGTPDGVLNHTQSSRSENRYWYNGVESGELAQNALIAGHFDVPLIMVTGDVATCREAHQFFGNDIVTVATKKGFAREAAELYPFEQTRKALYEGAKNAVAAIPKVKPYKIDMPIQAKKQYLDLNSDLPEPPVIIKEGIIESALEITNF